MVNVKIYRYAFERGRQSKIPLKENGVFSFNSKDYTNTFRRFFSNLAGSLLRFPHPKNKFGIKIKSIISGFEINVRILLYTMNM